MAPASGVFARGALQPRPAPPGRAVDSPDHFGVARTISALVAGWMTLGVFHDTESAERWLAHHLRREAT